MWDVGSILAAPFEVSTRPAPGRPEDPCARQLWYKVRIRLNASPVPGPALQVCLKGRAVPRITNYLEAQCGEINL